MVEPTTDLATAEPSINQVSLYALTPEVANFADALTVAADEVWAIDTPYGLRGELHLVRRRLPQPRWLDFLRAISDRDVTAPEGTRLSAVLFLERDARRFAIAFGLGRHLLRRDVLEPDYGLKVAAGLVNPEEIASLDSRSAASTAIQVRRQSARGVTPAAIGFNVTREMLRAIAGRLEDDNLGTRITGSDAVGLSARLEPTELPARIDALQAAYDASRYRDRFPSIDRWSSVRPGPTLDRLNAQLLDVLVGRQEMVARGEDPDLVPGPDRPPVLEAPEVIEWRAAGFRSNREPNDVVHPFPSLDAYLEALGRPPSLSDIARNHSLLLVSTENHDVVQSWPILGSLNWEVELGGEVYVLAEGRWWRIEAGYRQRIDERVAAIEDADLDRPDFDPIEDEIDYNRRLARHRPGRAVLDRENARIQHENGTVEPCDVLTIERQFVHVKRGLTSAALTHQFAQGSVSARLFLQLPEFRASLRGLLAGAPDLTALVPEARPNPTQYQVVYGIIRETTGPLAVGLPFFARNVLAQEADEIELLGYSVRVARIEERAGARPADAGPLYREETGDPRPKVVYRSSGRARRRAATAPPGATVTVQPA